MHHENIFKLIKQGLQAPLNEKEQAKYQIELKQKQKHDDIINIINDLYAKPRFISRLINIILTDKLMLVHTLIEIIWYGLKLNKIQEKPCENITVKTGFMTYAIYRAGWIDDNNVDLIIDSLTANQIDPEENDELIKMMARIKM